MNYFPECIFINNWLGLSFVNGNSVVFK